MRRELLFALVLAACGGPPAATAPGVVVSAPAKWKVYDGTDLVLTMRDEAGTLTGTAPPPPGGAVTKHPWIDATAHDAAHEARLRSLLEGATGPEEFRERLRAAGYRIEPAP